MIYGETLIGTKWLFSIKLKYFSRKKKLFSINKIVLKLLWSWFQKVYLFWSWFEKLSCFHNLKLYLTNWNYFNITKLVFFHIVKVFLTKFSKENKNKVFWSSLQTNKNGTISLLSKLCNNKKMFFVFFILLGVGFVKTNLC